MTPREQTNFIMEYMHVLRSDILAKVDRMPENWNGFELRQFVADKAAESLSKMDRKRNKAYQNDKIINNL